MPIWISRIIYRFSKKTYSYTLASNDIVIRNENPEFYRIVVKAVNINKADKLAKKKADEVGDNMADFKSAYLYRCVGESSFGRKMVR